jgi:hypothetical protein
MKDEALYRIAASSPSAPVGFPVYLHSHCHIHFVLVLFVLLTRVVDFST